MQIVSPLKLYNLLKGDGVKIWMNNSSLLDNLMSHSELKYDVARSPAVSRLLIGVL